MSTSTRKSLRAALSQFETEPLHDQFISIGVIGITALLPVTAIAVFINPMATIVNALITITIIFAYFLILGLSASFIKTVFHDETA